MLRVFWNHLRISMQPNRKAGRASVQEGIIFIDYLAHLQEPGSNGAFRSNYWGPLVEMLEDWPEPVNWLHISATYATPQVIRSDVAECAAFNTAHPVHSLLHSYLGLGTFGQALRDYLQIRRFGKDLWKQRDVFVEEETGLDPSSLLYDLVKDQYFGRTAALNAFWIGLWETTIRALPVQRLGVYLFENQPWELAFLSAWQRTGLGRLLAVAHSTMRFWDLRYFGNKDASELDGRPIPDCVVVNGPQMKATAISGGYPENFLNIAEAIRSQTKVQPPSGPEVDLLVLGEYDTMQDENLIAMTEKVAQDLGPNTSVIYRPHPTAVRRQRSIPESDRWSFSEHTSLGAAIADCRVAVCGPTTSAALDARISGRSVIVVRNANTLLASPAEGLENVYVVTERDVTSVQGWAAVMSPVAPLDTTPLQTVSSLQRWHRILLDREKHE